MWGDPVSSADIDGVGGCPYQGFVFCAEWLFGAVASVRGAVLHAPGVAFGGFVSFYGGHQVVFPDWCGWMWSSHSCNNLGVTPSSAASAPGMSLYSWRRAGVTRLLSSCFAAHISAARSNLGSEQSCP